MKKSPSSRRALRDLIGVAALAALAFAILVRLDAFEQIAAFSRSHESWQMDELVTLAIVLAFGGAIYSYRRWRDQASEMALREKAEEEARVLRGLLPICASCKKIREKDGAWTVLETYLVRHTEAELTHGICPECTTRLYPEIARRKDAAS
ncbi:MAG: hypothetical protein ACREOU_06900 [Candidatus Eiseniibacteriota bacterium]